MANLPETPQWEEGIYQIEVSDPVLGGPDGISNRQGKQLASRTLYLKQQVEKGGSELAKHIAAADPHTQYAPKASPTFTGTPTAPTPANSDNSKKLATTEFVAKALAALAGSAPETLDTLKELADALGNDPNFATTVLNKLAEKLAKDQHGADIPDPALFVKNLGLGETINKASGAMQKSANGADISDVSVFRNALQLGTAATRDVGADNASKLLDLDSFRSMMSGNGYIYIPCIATTGNPVKLMLQWGTVATQKGADAGYALPFAFPYAGLFATGNRGTSGYNAAMNVRIASRTHISIQNWSPSGEGTEDCCFIALGY
ncbi:phage tail protein [Enterobacter hormaechei subsp. steigerwaltii]